MVEIPGLYPGGAYGVMVQAWQNVSGEYAGSSIQQVNATTSKLPFYSRLTHFLKRIVVRN